MDGTDRIYLSAETSPKVGGLLGVCRLLMGTGGSVAALLAACWWLAGKAPAVPWLAATRHTKLIPVALASLAVALAGVMCTWVMLWARHRAAAPPVARPSGWRRALQPGPRGDPGLIGRMARWPQALILSAPLLFVFGGIMTTATATLPAEPPKPDILIGVVTLVLVFPFLITERWLAGVPASRLPEAAGLRTLVLLPVLIWPTAAMVQIVATLGVPFAAQIDTALLIALGFVAAELWLRAVGRCFLPPPAPALATATIFSLLASAIADGVQTRSLIAPVRRHFGIDFSRSWALTYLRGAALPVLLLLLVACWTLTGVVLVGPDQRAMYERFGAPVAVLHPGAHVTLPWPLGQVRRLEFGTVHETTLSGEEPLTRLTGAEDLPPPEADRLWEQPHPGELIFLIASGSAAQQNFQVVSADIKLRYRVGLTDQSAMLTAYRVADPAALLRNSASRMVGRFFAGQVLDTVLGENREAIADGLRTAMQRDLDASGCGLELVSVVVEAIHPPAGAAEAYHDVQAAEIRANATIAAERGRAISNQAKARQYGTEITAQAHAAAAEITSTAVVDLTRFVAEHAAATTGGEAFLLERRLTAIATGLAKSALTIIDHRIPAADAPVLDLRPLSAVTARSGSTDQE